jgi:hypothetical protein
MGASVTRYLPIARSVPADASTAPSATDPKGLLCLNGSSTGITDVTFIC